MNGIDDLDDERTRSPKTLHKPFTQPRSTHLNPHQTAPSTLTAAKPAENGVHGQWAQERQRYQARAAAADA